MGKGTGTSGRTAPNQRHRLPWTARRVSTRLASTRHVSTLILAWGAALAWETQSTSAHAVEVGTVSEEPVVVDVTATSSVVYNGDNRNTRPADVATVADDDWGAWTNRINLQSHWGSWQAGLRLDTAWFYTSPAPADVALELLQIEKGTSDTGSYTPEDAQFFLQKYLQAGEELSNRYVNWVYPAKYYLNYKHKLIDANVGDFTAQFGRGLTLSVRKVDELANDTSIRGIRLSSSIPVEDWRLKLTGLGGALNPVRLDDASGRYLSVDSSVTDGFTAITEAGMPYPAGTDFVPNPRPTYAPDQIIGLEAQLGPSALKFSTQGTVLFRQAPLSEDIVRNAKQIATGSFAVDAPDLWGQGAAYVEVAGQALEPSSPEAATVGGHAVYGSTTLYASLLTFTAELKHYRRFFPLRANVDLTRAREFSAVQYSQAPTTEPVWNDTQFENFNTCVTGGRLRTDARLGDNENVFAWAGHYRTWAESVSNDQCDTSDENLNVVWDFASGLELTYQQRKSRAEGLVGSRFDDTDRLISAGDGTQTHVFYREIYARYDVIQWLTGPYSLQFQGWLRRRRQTLGGPDGDWHQGQTINEFKWGELLSAALGLEYDQNPAFPSFYVNGQLRYNLDAGSNLVLFVGQRQGGLRCVAGVCRVFPPFEGARLDATFRF